MRYFDDDEGRGWDATVGRESYGMQVIVFCPRSGGGVRKTLMASSTRLEAHQELDALSDGELRERLADSQPWEDETGLPS